MGVDLNIREPLEALVRPTNAQCCSWGTGGPTHVQDPVVSLIHSQLDENCTCIPLLAQKGINSELHTITGEFQISCAHVAYLAKIIERGIV